MYVLDIYMLDVYRKSMCAYKRVCVGMCMGVCGFVYKRGCIRGEHILHVEHGMCMYMWKQGYEGYM